MFDLLILHELNKSTLTMYGISREIKSFFSMFITPSFGTLSPALSKLQSFGYVKSQKNISEGGRVSVYYSITDNGKEYLKELLLQEPAKNPIQFMTYSRIKLICSGVLNNSEKTQLCELIKRKAEIIVSDTENLLKNKNTEPLHRLVYDNLICEYKNLISFTEGLEHGCKN